MNTVFCILWSCVFYGLVKNRVENSVSLSRVVGQSGIETCFSAWPLDGRQPILSLSFATLLRGFTAGSGLWPSALACLGNGDLVLERYG